MGKFIALIFIFYTLSVHSLPSFELSTDIIKPLRLKGGFDTSSLIDQSEVYDEKIQITLDSGKQLSVKKLLEGVYSKTSWDVNGRPHYEREIRNDPKGEKLHIYWSGNQWMIHYDIEPSRNFDNLIAYAKIRVHDPKKTSSYWHVRVGKVYEPLSSISLSKLGGAEEPSRTQVAAVPVDEILGVPRRLFPLYVSFMLDAISVGIVLPLLPFYIMELGANAFQLSLVISSNYVAQTIGCLLMGRISDKYGRKLNALCCLGASFASYFCISRARDLKGVALARIISGCTGGLVPVMQTCVADIASQELRPKYLGRIMASFGLGFVLGPLARASLAKFSTREKIRIASLLPLAGCVISAVCFRETKEASSEKSQTTSPAGNIAKVVQVKTDSSAAPITVEVMLLVLNGFLSVYAFSTESIYAIFMKDSFGYGERALSSLFALNGLVIGIVQVFFIKPIVSMLGKHGTLGVGDFLLAFGMLGVALIRQKHLHFFLFGLHVVGYSVIDTALASLISKYSSPATLGRDLALSQAAQAFARVLSPVIAGVLYERGKSIGSLPIGALPFLVGSLFPALAITIPSLLYIRSVGRKMKAKNF